eukprot:1356675-Pyramimonas_sp.AAC.1
MNRGLSVWLSARERVRTLDRASMSASMFFAEIKFLRELLKGYSVGDPPLRLLSDATLEGNAKRMEVSVDRGYLSKSRSYLGATRGLVCISSHAVSNDPD